MGRPHLVASPENKGGAGVKGARTKTTGRMAGIWTKAQIQAIALLAEGELANYSIAAAVGVSGPTFEKWTKIPGFLTKVKELQVDLQKNVDVEAITKSRAQGRRRNEEPIDPKIRNKALKDFELFRQFFLGRNPVKCQKRWAQWIMDEDRTVILCPRKHGKTFTVRDYVIWRIVQDRNIRVLVISRNERNARRWIKSIKAILSGNKKLISYYGIFQPPGRPEKWTQSEIIVDGADPAMEDPTLVSLGMTAAMDGLRADLIICDDPVDVASSDSEDLRARSEEVMLGSIENILDNTLGRQPKLVVIGTRKHVLDLYAKLIKTDGFNVHVEKAVTHWGDKTNNYRAIILCPELYDNTVIEGVTYKNGIEFFRAQRNKDLKRFNREWMNAAFDDRDVIVPPDAFDDNKNQDYRRVWGKDGALPGWYTVLVVDPGVTLRDKGSFAASVVGFDPNEPGRRFFIDHYEGIMPSEDQPRFICAWHHEYGCSAVRIENNACQKYLMDSVQREAMLGGSWGGIVYPSRSIDVQPHFTSFTKLNHPVAGLETVARYFEKGLWSLPCGTPEDKARTQDIIDGLVNHTYREHEKAHTLMTLWFAENQFLDMQTQTLQVIQLEVPAYREVEEDWIDIRR